MTSGDGLFETEGQGRDAAPVVLVPSGEYAGRAGREPLFPLSPCVMAKMRSQSLLSPPEKSLCQSLAMLALTPGTCHSHDDGNEKRKVCWGSGRLRACCIQTGL